MPTLNITDITPTGTYVNAVRPADKALRAMATEEAARSRQRRSDHVPVPWRGGLACVGILATVVVALFS